MKLSYKRTTVDVPLWVLRRLKRKMRWVRAAGCIIKDDAGNMLLIRRNDRWDLPKGKVEEGETLLAAATRESNEETGLDVFSMLGKKPLKTYHIYNLYGGWHLKQTSWFPGYCAGIKPAGNPQQEEGITEIVWVSPDEWHRRLMQSYGTMRIIADKWQQSTT
ncbi:MAG: NUDIX domain-containing protein [Bacteroidales bacterium]|nr:NUDIX domain-containing protein [Bacteroidales bacterium]